MRVPLLAVLAVAAATAGCSSAKSAQPAIQVSVSHCGQGWSHPHSGQQTLQISNTGDSPAEAYVVEVPGGQVYGELENLAPGTTRALEVTLGGGRYAIRCVPDGSDPITGPIVRISGPARTGTGFAPISDNDLYGPAKTYQAYVTRGLVELAARTDALARAVAGGDLGAARTAWLPAHLAYERLGAAYGAFGDFDGEINGRPDGLPKGVADPDFTGFHRVEYGLWHGEPAASLKGPAGKLAAAVRGLQADFLKEQVDPADLGLRAHEILEGTMRFELSGEADQGSGTSLATAAANIDGTREVLGVLRPLLVSRYPGLPGTDAALARLDRLLADQQRGGTWTPVDRLSVTDRQRLDAAAGDAVERLAPVATICASRRTT